MSKTVIRMSEDRCPTSKERGQKSNVKSQRRKGQMTYYTRRSNSKS